MVRLCPSNFLSTSELAGCALYTHSAAQTLPPAWATTRLIGFQWYILAMHVARLGRGLGWSRWSFDLMPVIRLCVYMLGYYLGNEIHHTYALPM
jgi:hypothetical protein